MDISHGPLHSRHHRSISQTCWSVSAVGETILQWQVHHGSGRMASGNARIGRFDPQKRHFHSMVSWNMISLNQIFQGQLRQRIHHNTPGRNTAQHSETRYFKPPRFSSFHVGPEIHHHRAFSNALPRFIPSPSGEFDASWVRVGKWCGARLGTNSGRFSVNQYTLW